MHKMRVVSDRYGAYKKHMKDMGMPPDMMGDCVPVDMYGKQVFNKGEGDNLAKAQDDLRDFYDLEGDAGME